jgi:hypothetical protein
MAHDWEGYRQLQAWVDRFVAVIEQLPSTLLMLIAGDLRALAARCDHEISRRAGQGAEQQAARLYVPPRAAGRLE